MDNKLGIYFYGITKFSLCYNKDTEEIENDLLIMYYGHDKKYVFKKEKAFELIRAINGDKNPNGSEFDREVFEFELKHFDLLSVLDSRLKGRGFLMITGFKSLAEYTNGIQNELVGITGLDIDGKFLANNIKDLFRDGFANYDVETYDEPPENYVQKDKEPSYEA